MYYEYIGAFLGMFFIIRYKTYAYSFVLAWAFFGIYSKQIIDSKVVGDAALFASSALLALVISDAIMVRQRIRK